MPAPMTFGWRLSTLVLALLTTWLARPALGGEMAFIWQDALFSEIALHHLQGVMLHGGDWRALPLAWPLPDPVTQTDWMLGQAIVGLPLAILGVEPLRVYVGVSLLGLLTTALACDRVAAALLGEGPHTWAAGVTGGFGAAQVLHAPHANLVWHAFGPLAALLLIAGLRRDRAALCALAGALPPLAFHFGVYLGLHAALVFAIAVPFAAARAGGTRRGWLAVASGVVIGAATVLPVARVYLDAAPAARLDLVELVREALDLGHPSGPPNDPLLPGAGMAALAVVGMWAKRRGGWPWALAAVVGLAALVFALGPAVQWRGRVLAEPAPWGALLHLVPALASLRAPARWLTVFALALSPFAAAGVAYAAARSRVAGGLALLLVVHDLRVPPFGQLRRVASDPSYDLLVGTAIPGPVLDHAVGACHGGPRRVAAVLAHGHALVGGHYARETQALAAANRLADAWPSAATVAWLRETGVRLVFDHPPLPRAPDGATCETSRGHRLCVLAP